MAMQAELRKPIQQRERFEMWGFRFLSSNDVADRTSFRGHRTSPDDVGGKP